MATDKGTVELPSETTDDEMMLAEARDAISAILSDDPENPQKPDEQEPATEGEPPQETETTPETEPEVPPAAEAEDNEELALPPEVQESVNKRMNQLTAKRREAEEARAAAESEMESLKAKVKELTDAAQQEPQAQLPPDADPVLRVPEINKLWQEEQKYDNARREVSALLREYEDSPDAVFEKMQARMPKQGFATAKQVKLFLEDVKDDALMKLNHLRSQRENASSRHVQRMEKEAEKFHSQAVKAYPDVLDKNSPMGKQVAEIAKTMPALFNPALIPNGWEIATDLAAGRLQRLAKAAAPAVKPTPPKLPVAGKAASTASVTRTVVKPHAALRAKAEETGEMADVARLMEAII